MVRKVARFGDIALAATMASALVGCYADGNSQFLAKGKTKWFLTMSACQREATATYTSGGVIYSGFECHSRFAGFIVETRAYENGRRVR